MNRNDKPFDYLEAIEQFRKEEHTPDNLVRSPGKTWPTPMTEGYVDYQAAAKAWDKKQAGKYVIYTEEHENEGKL